MRKLLCFVLVLTMSFLTFSVFAQQKLISGKVTSTEDNKPLPGVTVAIKGTNRSTTTDANGDFRINGSTGDVLQFSFVGRSPLEVTVRNNNPLSVQLATGENVLNEVVVAMDIRRNPRELGYSVQTVKGSDIQQTQRENFVNSLARPCCRTDYYSYNWCCRMLLRSVVLRGFNTLSGNNQPLFIVDGVLIDNSTFNSNSYSGSGMGLASDGN